jgi:5-(carboxyamino)imidazole ribonucleotide mutase
MGSQSDWPTLQHAASVLDELAILHEAKVVSAHRTPERLYRYAERVAGRGVRVVIAGAGGAAHLPGMVAAMTLLPVIAVPVKSAALNGMDSLLSIVQMPRGVAVATQAIGESGAFNAGLLAAQVLALSDPALGERLAAWRRQRAEAVAEELVL